MGESQKIPYDQLLREARERFDNATDLTVSVEEEFAILDPTTLDLVNRFEDVQAAAADTPLIANLAGELIASEVEIKTGRQETSSTQSQRFPSGGRSSSPSSSLWAHARRDRVAPLGELEGSADHRHAALPAQRRDPQVRRLEEHHVRPPCSCRGPGADRAIAAVNGVRNWLPELLALSSSSPFAESVNTGLHSARTQIFTRFFPRCGVPDTFASWDEYERYVRFLYETRSIDENTQLWWSIRPHFAFPTVEIRICDAQPEAAEAQALVAFVAALTARVIRAYDEGEPMTLQPHRLLEENLWRAIRYGLSGELIDLAQATCFRPAPGSSGSSSGSSLWPRARRREAPPGACVGPAERQIARFEEGASLETIYAEQVGSTAPARIG